MACCVGCFGMVKWWVCAATACGNHATVVCDTAGMFPMLRWQHRQYSTSRVQGQQVGPCKTLCDFANWSKVENDTNGPLYAVSTSQVTHFIATSQHLVVKGNSTADTG